MNGASSLSWFIAALAIIFVFQFIDDRLFLILPFAITYVAVFLGSLNPKRLWIVSSGDYSYGMFLYHRQVQQALWVALPVAETWYGNFILSLIVCFLISYVSWKLVEKPALGLKRFLYARESKLGPVVI